MPKGWEFGLLLRFLCPFAANLFTSRGLELKHQGRNVPSAAPRRALPSVQSVSKISPTSACLARAKLLASSGAVTGSFTVARAVLTALTRSFFYDRTGGSSLVVQDEMTSSRPLAFGTALIT